MELAAAPNGRQTSGERRPAFAHVVSSLGRAVGATPLFDLAFNPEDIKARLSRVPVYTVVNNKNEFVLVSADQQHQQLGLFFMTQTDAQALLETIKKQQPKLAKQVKVVTTSMDRVYQLTATAPAGGKGGKADAGVIFRLVPDGAQVEAALALYKGAGVRAGSFAGVPLFQAEGLTVRGEEARYTPLFFSKGDLDAALGSAFTAKEVEQQADLRAKAARARGEAADAAAEAAAAAGDKGAAGAARKKKAAAEERARKYEAQLAELHAKKKVPRVDVGSLEEVISKMEADDRGEWGDVMFVPPGALGQEE